MESKGKKGVTGRKRTDKLKEREERRKEGGREASDGRIMRTRIT